MEKLKTFYKQFTQSYVILIDDKKTGRPVTCFPMSELQGRWVEIVKKNEEGFGVFMTPNPCNGGRKAENVISLEWLYCDIDGGDKEKQRDTIFSSPICPDMIVESCNGYHLYWKCHSDNIEQFEKAQKGIIKFFSADPACKDPSRVLRLPPFKHMKQDPFDVKIYHLDIKEHAINDMINAFPFVEEVIEHKPRNLVNDDSLEVLDRIKAIPIKDVLSKLGVQWNRKNEIIEGGKATSGVINEKANYVNRFSGKEGSGSTIDVVMGFGNMDKVNAIKWLKEYAGIDEQKVKVERIIEKSQEFTEDSGKRFTWGTDELNKNFAVIKDQTYSVLVGETGEGKTTFAYDMSIKNAKLGHKVLYLSLEMTTQELLDNIGKAYAGITIEEDHKKCIPDNKVESRNRKIKEITNIENLITWGIRAESEITWKDLEVIIQAKMPIDMLVLDNLDLIYLEKEMPDNQRQREVSRKIMAFTASKHIPVFLIHHYNKKGKQQTLRSMSDISGSSKITHDAHNVVHIMRKKDPECEAEKFMTTLFLEKARTGNKCVKEVYFNRGVFQDDIPDKIKSISERQEQDVNDLWFKK